MDPTTVMLATLVTCICLYHFILNKLLYFQRLKVPHVRPIPFLGNMSPYIFRRLSMTETIQKIYNQFPNAKYFGFYDLMRPIYVIRDPDLINTIAIKNFDSFTDHVNFLGEEDESVTSKNLFTLRGDHWRQMRKLINPVFTTNKIKKMLEMICQCADNFTTFVATTSEASGTIYNMKEMQRKYATDVVASCAFGIKIDSFQNPDNEFYTFGNETFDFNGSLSINLLLNRTIPWIMNIIKRKAFQPKVDKFFKDLVIESVKIRKEQGIINQDLIQLMMEIDGTDHKPAFDIDDMAAQVFIFFFGGFETVSSMMSFVTHEIGVNPDVQHKLRTEIDNVVRLTDGKPTYEAIKDMKYLDAVINETLRMYPLLPFLDRVCVKEFELPPTIPDGKPIKLKPGDIVWFSSYSLQRDPKYYSEPNKFNPNRFLNKRMDNSMHMSFGVGPRICIAIRFALLEIKIMIFYLLWRCQLEPTDKTRNPVILNKKTFLTMAEDGFWLKMRARS